MCVPQLPVIQQTSVRTDISHLEPDVIMKVSALLSDFDFLLFVFFSLLHHLGFISHFKIRVMNNMI